MSKLNKILLATDGSEPSIHAAKFAGELARSTNASVHILTCHNQEILNLQLMSAAGWPTAVPNASVSIDEVKTSVEASADTDIIVPAFEAIGDLTPKPISTQRWGHPAEEICDYAKENQVDVIVIGSRGRSTFAKLLLGSVTMHVLNHAACPVTVVR